MFFSHSEYFYCLINQKFLFFTKSLCIFDISSIIASNFPKSNVHRNLFQNIVKNIGNILHIVIFIFFVLVIWQVNAFCITLFFMVIIRIFLALVFIVFTAIFLNMFLKLFYIIGIFTHFSIIICFSFLCIIFRIFYYFVFVFSCLCSALTCLF